MADLADQLEREAYARRLHHEDHVERIMRRYGYSRAHAELVCRGSEKILAEMDEEEMERKRLGCRHCLLPPDDIDAALICLECRRDTHFCCEPECQEELPAGHIYCARHTVHRHAAQTRSAGRWRAVAVVLALGLIYLLWRGGVM